MKKTLWRIAEIYQDTYMEDLKDQKDAPITTENNCNDPTQNTTS